LRKRPAVATLIGNTPKGAEVGAVARPIIAERVKRRSPNGVWVVAERSTLTNELLVGALHERGIRAQLVHPARLGRLARRGGVVLGRLHVRGTLDGVEDGIGELRRVERRGIRVLNSAGSLIACHDKLQTASDSAGWGFLSRRRRTSTGVRPRPQSSFRLS
jgi:hypothetical protein